jgi:hypothetical protein
VCIYHSQFQQFGPVVCVRPEQVHFRSAMEDSCLSPCSVELMWNRWKNKASETLEYTLIAWVR